MNTYTEPYVRQYFVKRGSYEQVFCFLILYLTIALPFYFSFGNENFWLKEKYETVNCHYNFTGIYALQVNSLSGTSSLNEQQSNIVGYPSDNLTLSGWTVDEQSQSMQLEFSLSGFAAKEILSVNLILYFDVWIEELEKKVSVGLLDTFQGDRGFVESQTLLTYEPESAINSMTELEDVNYEAYLPDLQSPSSFSSLVEHIIDNEEVHCLNQKTSRVESNGAGLDIRSFRLNYIKDLKVVVPYYPSILETLKFAFSKWAAFAIIAGIVFFTLVHRLAREGALEVKVLDEKVR